MWIDPLRARIDSATAEERLFAEFLIEWAQASAALAGALGEAGRDAAAQAPVHGLFRALHSQKSGLRMLRLDAAADLVHALEDALEPVRAGRTPLDAGLIELLRLCSRLLDHSLHRHALELPAYVPELAPITRALQRLPASGSAREEQLAVLRVLLDPWSAPQLPAQAQTLHVDMEMFRRIGCAADARLQRDPECALWREQLAGRLHAAAGLDLPVDQLLAAALLWNVGRAQLPADLRLLERAPAEESRRRVWSGHPQVAAAFLDARPAWRTAAGVLARQLDARAAGPAEATAAAAGMLKVVAAWVASGGRQQRDEQALRGTLVRLGQVAEQGWLQALLALLDSGARD
jgi:HPt (histidine-containing phosphotransfer) domain-containing protein